MKKAPVYSADQNPIVDRPAYRPLSELENLVGLKRAKRLTEGKRPTYQYLPDPDRIMRTNQDLVAAIGYDAAVVTVLAGRPAGFLDAWGQRPSGGINVWQLKTR